MYALPPVAVSGVLDRLRAPVTVTGRHGRMEACLLCSSSPWHTDWARQCNMGAARGLSMSDRLVCRDTDDVTYHDGVLVVLRCVRRVCSV